MGLEKDKHKKLDKNVECVTCRKININFGLKRRKRALIRVSQTS